MICCREVVGGSEMELSVEDRGSGFDIGISSKLVLMLPYNYNVQVNSVNESNCLIASRKPSRLLSCGSSSTEGAPCK